MIQVNAKTLTEAEDLVKEFRGNGFVAQIVESHILANGEQYGFKIIVG